MSVLNVVLEYLALFPPALLCFFPMKDQLRYSRGKTAWIVGGAIAVASVLCGFVQYTFQRTGNDMILVMLAVCYLAYHRCLKAPLCKSLAVFCASVALMSILTNIALCLGALLYGASIAGQTVWQTNLVQFALNAAFTALLAYPYAKYGSAIVNETQPSRIWYTTLLFSAFVFLLNMLLLPIEDAVARDAEKLGTMLLVLAAILVLWLLMQFLFHFIVTGILAHARMEERNRFLEMQESQFAAQQRYMKATEKERHDFRHSIRTLAELYDGGDQETLGRYLHQYVEAMPASEVTDYCANAAVNALLNYYAHLAAQDGIDFRVQVRLPEGLPVTDVDLCSMLGNILSNAVKAAQKAEERRIRLTVLAEDASQLYIVAVNSFNGTVRQKDGAYLSTDRSGSGVGLSSVASTAEAYGGVARFSHKGKEFYSNVAIPLG